MKKIALISLLVITAFSSSSKAFDYKILAIVDGQSISTAQLRDRVNLVIASSGMKETAEAKKKLTAEMADILINEILQKKDAETKGIAITEDDTNAVLADLEKRNQLKPGGFKKYIEGKGLSYATMIEQINASILWKNILGRYVRPDVKVTKADIDKAIANAPKPVEQKYKVNLSEIIIPIEFASEKESKDLADTLVRTARTKSQDFGALAQKYSAGKTATKKGALGWVPEDGITEPIVSVVKRTAVGKVSDPIKVKSLYVIIKVNDRQSLIPVDNTPPEERAFMAKMEEGAKKYMKNLRDAAFIEKKYTDENLYNFVWN